MICFLFALMPTYVRGKTEMTNADAEKNYFKMMASYMIYVHLFNTFCNVRMISTWNTKIKNSYVYKYENINGRQPDPTRRMNFDSDEVASRAFEYIINEIGTITDGENIKIKEKTWDKFIENISEDNIQALYNKLREILRRREYSVRMERLVEIIANDEDWKNNDEFDQIISYLANNSDVASILHLYIEDRDTRHYIKDMATRRYQEIIQSSPESQTLPDTTPDYHQSFEPGNGMYQHPEEEDMEKSHEESSNENEEKEESIPAGNYEFNNGPLWQIRQQEEAEKLEMEKRENERIKMLKLKYINPNVLKLLLVNGVKFVQFSYNKNNIDQMPLEDFKLAFPDVLCNHYESLLSLSAFQICSTDT